MVFPKCSNPAADSADAALGRGVASLQKLYISILSNGKAAVKEGNHLFEIKAFLQYPKAILCFQLMFALLESYTNSFYVLDA